VELAAAAALKNTEGVRGIVVAIGGDLRVTGRIDHEVMIADPFADADNAPAVARVVVREKAVATSGGYRRGVRVGGRWYSHIVDPRSGWPVDHVASSTAIADHAADADALATIFNVLPVEESLRLADRIPGVACYLITREGARIANDRWSHYAAARAAGAAAPAIEIRGPDRAAVAAAVNERGSAAPKSGAPSRTAAPSTQKPEASPSETWSADFELLVQFEINKPDGGGRYRRPYVAVWVENSDGLPIRTLAVWLKSGKGQRWLPDLRRWHRNDKKRRDDDDSDVLGTVSGATRAPGNYKLLWDGKNDGGMLVKNGKYTVFIESAREHGTYQLLKEDIEVSGKPFTSELKDQDKNKVEIKGASLEYRRKSSPDGK
jgi:hypothetical protein